MNDLVSIISSLVILLFPYIGRYRFSVQTLSSTVVSLGLLGTFGGIMFGLIHFDVKAIDDSIPQLLEGLKTAFLTSIAGMTSSLILKLCPKFYGIKQENETQEASAIDQMIYLLTEIKENTRSSSNAEIISEIKISREELKAHLNKLNDSVLQLSEKESHLNTDLLTQALQDLITKVNQNISEQVNSTLTEIHFILQKQLECSNLSQQRDIELKEHLQNSLQAIQEVNRNIETFLHKSNNLNLKQNESFSTQITHFGNFVKTTEEHIETQMNHMEERYEKELSEMEKFTKTLMSIIKKLAQDHETLYKDTTPQN